mmetsp:Transcript_2859/g.8719  ORF Transcript_2859/g.8719 Transcript_2859/m.8719 type:complete len:326 (-) Transcript_2859:75-1052(-)
MTGVRPSGSPSRQRTRPRSTGSTRSTRPRCSACGPRASGTGGSTRRSWRRTARSWRPASGARPPRGSTTPGTGTASAPCCSRSTRALRRPPAAGATCPSGTTSSATPRPWPAGTSSGCSTWSPRCLQQPCSRRIACWCCSQARRALRSASPLLCGRGKWRPRWHGPTARRRPAATTSWWRWGCWTPWPWPASTARRRAWRPCGRPRPGSPRSCGRAARGSASRPCRPRCARRSSAAWPAASSRCRWARARRRGLRAPARTPLRSCPRSRARRTPAASAGPSAALRWPTCSSTAAPRRRSGPTACAAPRARRRPRRPARPRRACWT